jgi:outer membrane protein W
MKRILAGVLALALVGYLGCAANAAEIIAQGAQRVAITGSADYASTYGDVHASAATWATAGEYEYMFLDQFGVGLRGGWLLMETQAKGGGNAHLQSYALDIVPKWHIPLEGNIAPYVGPKAGVSYVTDSVSGHGGGASASATVCNWGAVLGVDIFLSKNCALNIEYDYTQYNVRTPRRSLGVPLGGAFNAVAAGNITVQDNAVTLGLAYWW